MTHHKQIIQLSDSVELHDIVQFMTNFLHTVFVLLYFHKCSVCLVVSLPRHSADLCLHQCREK